MVAVSPGSRWPQGTFQQQQLVLRHNHIPPLERPGKGIRLLVHNGLWKRKLNRALMNLEVSTRTEQFHTEL